MIFLLPPSVGEVGETAGLPAILGPAALVSPVYHHFLLQINNPGLNKLIR